MRTITLFLLLIVIPIQSQTAISLDEVKQAGLLMVEITTVDGEEPEGELIESPLFHGSYNIVYKNKVPCQIVISKGEQTIYDSGPYVKNVSGSTIRMNGNTSAYFSNPLNMPYKLKLEKAADLLNRGNEGKYKDKEWRLLKDAVSLNTIVGLKLSQLLELEWTSSYVPCNVVINGDYRGCYLLMETMKRNESCRINCDKKTGYIIEKDPYWFKEDKYFSSLWYKDDNVYRYTWKYPDEDDVTEEQETYIKQYIESMENSLADGSYESYIDITSFAKWILTHDILATRDSWGSNMYLKKFDNTENSRLELPCVWDFDSSNELTYGSFSNLHTQENEYFYALFNSSHHAFTATYVNLWNSKKEYVLEQVLDFLTQYADSEEAKALDTSRSLYNKRFGYVYPTVNHDVQKQKQWYNQHIQLLNEKIQLLTSNIEVVNNRQKELQKAKYYTITGIEIKNKSNKGIIIHKLANGKSYKIIH